MLKLLIYLALAGVGGYILVTHLPPSLKAKAVSAMGLNHLEVLNPAAARSDLLNKLSQDMATIKNAGNSKTDPNQLSTAVADSQNLISQIQDLNSKTGIWPNLEAKILGVTPPAPTTLTADQITPELKAQVCSQNK